LCLLAKPLILEADLSHVVQVIEKSLQVRVATFGDFMETPPVQRLQQHAFIINVEISVDVFFWRNQTVKTI
jgi:hypothetical protein